MTQNSRLSEITVRASHSVRLDGLRRNRLALSGLTLMALLAPPAASAAYGETLAKSQAEVKTEFNKTGPLFSGDRGVFASYDSKVVQYGGTLSHHGNGDDCW